MGTQVALDAKWGARRDAHNDPVHVRSLLAKLGAFVMHKLRGLEALWASMVQGRYRCCTRRDLGGIKSSVDLRDMRLFKWELFLLSAALGPNIYNGWTINTWKDGLSRFWLGGVTTPHKKMFRYNKKMFRYNKKSHPRHLPIIITSNILWSSLSNNFECQPMYHVWQI